MERRGPCLPSCCCGWIPETRLGQWVVFICMELQRRVTRPPFPLSLHRKGVAGVSAELTSETMCVSFPHLHRRVQHQASCGPYATVCRAHVARPYRWTRVRRVRDTRLRTFEQVAEYLWLKDTFTCWIFFFLECIDFLFFYIWSKRRATQILPMSRPQEQRGWGGWKLRRSAVGPRVEEPQELGDKEAMPGCPHSRSL